MILDTAQDHALTYDDGCSDKVAGKDSSHAWGFPEFISYDNLCMESPARQYVKDDSVFIKVSYHRLEA